MRASLLSVLNWQLSRTRLFRALVYRKRFGCWCWLFRVSDNLVATDRFHDYRRLLLAEWKLARVL